MKFRCWLAASRVLLPPQDPPLRRGSQLMMNRHQLHVRITSSQYKFLTDMAESSEETIAALVRRLIRAAIRARERVSTNGTIAVPSVLTERASGNTSRPDGHGGSRSQH